MILVIGAGAVGSFIGATLAGGGCDVTVLGRRASSPDGVRSASGSTKVTVAGPGTATRVAEVALAGSADELADAPELIITAVTSSDSWRGPSGPSTSGPDAAAGLAALDPRTTRRTTFGPPRPGRSTL